MAGAAPVSASSGVMNSIIGKLTTLLTDEYNHLKSVKRGISWLRDELSSMNAVLQRLADMDDDKINVQTKEWRNKVRELSYDIEDCIDRFMQKHSSGGDAKANFVRKGVRKMKKLWENHRIGDDIKQLKARVVEEGDRRIRYNIDQLITSTQHVLLDPRAPALYEQTRNLVGIDKPREKIIGWIKSEEEQLKVISIFGAGGLGKTTLAMEVYNKIEECFDCRAMISVSRTPDMKKLFRDILFQINKSEYKQSKEWEMEQLIPSLRENLKDKRYFVVIDDIWTTYAWEHLQAALPVNDNRSRIITTTRIRGVAKMCCGDFGGHMYEAMPLSDENSCKLFFRRIFSKDYCPNELIEPASVIMRKCGGLPLAIICIAGLLSNKNPTVEVWAKMKNSISSALQDSSVDKMKRILFLSYFDLPHYLKTCLLYLSVFPEDFNIGTRRLICLWVAEGLVPGQNRECMEQQGENYLHELINRSMIQPINIGADGTVVKSCRLHDVVHDFIVSQAVEENFVTILNSNDSCDYSSNKVRRLSLQSGFSECLEAPKGLEDLSHLRSFHIFESRSVLLVPSKILKCQVLRVLDIQITDNLEDNHIKYIGHFCELKYLRIKGDISKLPEQIGKLRHLETLDLTETCIEKLPASIVQLQKLVRLFIPNRVSLPDGIGNLRALEVLSFINLGRASVKSIYGLSQLTKLREVEIFWENCDGDNSQEGRKTTCISSLSKLLKCSLQSLLIWESSSSDAIASCILSCGSLYPLRRLVLFNEIPTIPSQFMSLVNLTRLNVDVGGVEGLDILASLPMLLSLTLGAEPGIPNLRQVIGGQGFQNLRKFHFRSWNTAVGLMFEPGAMPKLQRLKLWLSAWCQLDVHGGLVVGLHHLSACKYISLQLDSDCAIAADEVQSLEDDIRAAAVVHPNRPTFEIRR